MEIIALDNRDSYRKLRGYSKTDILSGSPWTITFSNPCKKIKKNAGV